MSKLYKYIVALMASAFISVSAMAGEGMSGFSIGVKGTTADFDTSGHEKEGGETNDGSASNSVDFGEVFVEYSTGSGQGGGVTMGISWIPGSAELGTKSRTDTGTESDGSTSSMTYKANAEVDNHVTVYFEPTYNFTDGMGLFVRAGVSHVDVLTLESLANGTDSSSYGDTDTFGGMLGVGFKAQHESGMFAKIDASKTIYQTVKFTSVTGNLNKITASPEQSAVSLSIGYNF